MLVFSVHRFDELKGIVKSYKQKVDTSEKNYRQEEAEYAYKKFLKEKLENPVASEVAFYELLNKNPIKHIFSFYKRIEELEEKPSIKKLLNKISQKEESQSKTQFIRQMLIIENRIKLDKVTPKLTGIKKTLLKAKLY